MTINVTGPDGSNLAFPDGTPEATIVAAMRAHYGGAPAAKPEDQAVDVGNVVRSTARGVPIIGGVLNQVNAATNAALAPLIDPLLPDSFEKLPGKTFGERRKQALDIQERKDRGFDEAAPVTSTAAKVVGGIGSLVPAVMAAPAVFGATGTMGQMVTRGAASGAALSAADAAVRGNPVAEEAGIGAITGAAGGPLGRGIGILASKIANRGAKPVPQNTMPVAGADVPIPPSDPKAASDIEIARRGAAGDPAKAVVDQADAEVKAALETAQANIARQLDPTGTSPAATPQQAAERVAQELGGLEQQRISGEQARTAAVAREGTDLRRGLATDPYTGQPMDVAATPFDAAEAVGSGVGTRRDLALTARRNAYEARDAVPGAFDESVPRTMAEEMRLRLNQGSDPLWVDPDTTSVANTALKTVNQTLGEGGLFHNAAALKPGEVRPGADVTNVTGGVTSAPTDAEIAFRKLTAENVSPERARKAVANLPGAEAIPQGPLERHSVATAAGNSVELQPRVVEASTLKTSDMPGYNQDLQNRNRARAASDVQIKDMAKNLTPNRLGVSAEADRGAPIIGPDLMVESGNGRTMAIRQAYQQGGAQATKYREWLQSQGVDVAAFKEPVLVRERVTPMTHEQRVQFAIEANQSSTLSLAGAERAVADSRALSPEVLGLIRNPDDLGAVANRDFVRRFMETVPVSERNALMSGNGELSAEGLTRIRNAVMAKAYGNSSILQRAAESTKDEIKSISNALQSAAPEWAQLRAGVASGVVPKEMDATAHLLDAVERTARIRGKGTSLAEGLAQSDAFVRQSPESEAFMRLFYSADGKSAASSAQIGNAVRHYAQEASKTSTAPMLDMGMAPVTARDILATTSAKVGAPKELAEEIAKAAAEALPKPSSKAPISNIGLVEMDNARKRLVTMYSDAKGAALRSGDWADVRAMGRILREFDDIIIDAFEAGKFSGDAALGARLSKEARASHAEYKKAFSSRGAGDDVGRSIEKILGRYTDTAATPDEIAKLSYGPATAPGGGAAVRVNQRLREVLGPTSPEWGAHKQGLFEYVKGDAALSPAKQADRLEAFLTGTQGKLLAQTALTGPERAAWAAHARNLRASEPVALSDLNSVDKMVRRITGTDGNPPASTPEIINYLVGSQARPGEKSAANALVDRLKRDMTPEGFGIVKQGILSHALAKPEGLPELTHGAMVKNLSNLLNSDLALRAYTGGEIGDIRALRDAIKAQIPPPGTTNPSGTTPMLVKVAKGVAGWILPVLGFSHGGLIGAGVGVAGTKGISAAANWKAARDTRNLLYGQQPRMPVDPRFARAGALIGQGANQQIGSR